VFCVALIIRRLNGPPLYRAPGHVLAKEYSSHDLPEGRGRLLGQAFLRFSVIFEPFVSGVR
jgi:hypothetical protein